MRFRDRLDAGNRLAKALEQYRGRDPVVIALPRGGVVTGAQVAKYLGAPLDIIVAKKIGHPLSSEYAIGAVAESGDPVWGRDVTDAANVPRSERAAEVQKLASNARRRYLGNRQPIPLAGRTVIIVDDGIATGLTMEAAIGQARAGGAGQIVVAVPVAPMDTREHLDSLADSVVVLHEPRIGFGAVGQYYDEFEQTSDEEVRQLLSDHRSLASPTEPIDLTSLNAVLATISDYPVSSQALARQARRLHSPHSVVRFFESIPGGTTFKDKTDVISRSFESELLMEQELTEPPETPRAYD